MRALLYVLLAVVLLSTVTPTIKYKYVFSHWSVEPVMFASFRVLIAFVLLLGITALSDVRGLIGLARADLTKLSLLGVVGVASYGIAAWGLMKTTVTHYTFIYSLIPALTTLFAFVLRKEDITVTKAAGIGISLLGCLIAISRDLFGSAGDFGLGDGLVFLFTVMMAAHLAVGGHIAKRYGAMAANTVMFGSGALVLVALTLSDRAMPVLDCPLPILLAVVYIGCATAAVFVLRSLSLQALAPGTVAGYHNLVPVCTIVAAHVCLGEPILLTHVTGGILILAGLELVRRVKIQVSEPAAALTLARRPSGA